MNRRRAIRTITLAGAASLCKSRLFGIPIADDPESGYTIRSEVRLVLLDVSVTDSHGMIVSGLPKSSFRVIENGQEQPITAFENQDVPVTVGLVMDESRSMTPKRGQVLVAAEIFIQESNPHDEMFVLNFNDTVRRGLADNELFSDSTGKLRAALYRGKPQGKTALNDAIIDGLAQLDLGRQGKKTLVIISDGGDNASAHTQREMLDKAEQSIATVYTIGLFDEDDPDRNPGVLKRLAAISGGQAFFPSETSDIIRICRKIAKDIRARYTIGYVPKPGEETGLRHIQVRVSVPGRGALHARTRTAYRY